MYKRFNLDDLNNIKNNFLYRLERIVKQERCSLINDFCKHIFKQGDSVYYYFKSTPQFICSDKGDSYSFVDAVDSIEVVVDKNDMGAFSQLFKKHLVKKGKGKDNNTKTIEKILMDEFSKGTFDTINGKPYLVYDIETIGEIFDVRHQEFVMAYSAQPNNKKMKYDYIDKKGLEKYVRKLLDWDGYIVGFNNISFDNPVIIHNIGGTQEMIDELNKKSIDLFTFLYHSSGRKLGLNKVSGALIGVEKTLDSGLEGASLYKQYIENGDEDALKKFKDYCKNDVKMTILVLLYLIHYKRLHIDDKDISFDIDDLIQRGCTALGDDVGGANAEEDVVVSLF